VREEQKQRMRKSDGERRESNVQRKERKGRKHTARLRMRSNFGNRVIVF